MNVIVFIAGIVAAVTLATEGSKSLRNKVRELQKELKVTDDKISSTSKKMKKQMKKELRNNIFPQIREFMEDSMKEVIERRLFGEISTMAKALEILAKKLQSLEKRMKKVEEENTLLKTSLKASQDDCLSHILEINGCPVNRSHTDSPRLAMSSAPGTSMEITSPGTDQTVRNDTDILYLTTPRPAVSFEDEGITFNVSADMPVVWTGVSILVGDNDQLIRISLQNPTVQGTIKTDKYVESIAYDPVFKKLFWAWNRQLSIYSRYVLSAGLDGKGLSVLLKEKWIFSLAVDGLKQLVFMSDWTSSLVSSMSTNGQNYKVVRRRFNGIRQPKTIVLDTQGEKIFVSFSYHILTMNYDGSQLKRLAEGAWMKPMALDPVGGLLYFSDKKNLYRLNLNSKKKVLVNQMKHDMNTLLFYDDKLYIAYQKRNVAIDSLALRDNTVQAFTFLRGEWFRMCLIPAPH